MEVKESVTPFQWMAQFSEQENNEIKFASMYATTDDVPIFSSKNEHDLTLLLAKLATLLNKLEDDGHVAWL